MRVDPYFTSTLTTSLNNVQATQQQLASQLSSGVRVNNLSDDPAAAGQNVMLLNSIQKDDTFTQTATSVKGQLQVADTALGSIVTELTSAIQLATAGSNGTTNANNVQSISNQLTGIRSEVESLANTNYQGKYVFAGTSDSTVPFGTSSTTSPAVTTYNGDSSVNYVETPNGMKIQTNLPGDQLFLGNGKNSVFGALNNLIADFSSGTVDSNKAVTDTAALNTALNYVSQQRVTLDDSINQLTSASDAATSEKTQLTTAQTNLMQADVAQISTQLSLSETQQTALESVIAQLNSATNSLFSKLS